MERQRSLTFVVFLAGAIGGATCSRPDPEERTQEFQRRRAAIEAELTGPSDHPWAGSYYEGDGLGANVSIWLAPSGQAAAIWTGCLGGYGANWGTVFEQGGLLRLDFVDSNPRGDFGGFPEELVPVSWGERRYLIEPNQMECFASYVNIGWEPRAEVRGLFLLRDDDELRPAVGRPAVPEEYSRLFFDAPLVTRIVAVGAIHEDMEFGYEQRRLAVTVDVGRRHGAFPGLMFFGPGGIYELSEVEQESSTAYLDLYSTNEPPSLPIGTELVSRRDERDEDY